MLEKVSIWTIGEGAYKIDGEGGMEAGEGGVEIGGGDHPLLSSPVGLDLLKGRKKSKTSRLR